MQSIPHVFTTVEVAAGQHLVARFGDVVAVIEEGKAGAGELLDVVRSVAEGSLHADQMGAALAEVLNQNPMASETLVVAAPGSNGALRVVCHGWAAVEAGSAGSIPHGWADKELTDVTSVQLGRANAGLQPPLPDSPLNLVEGVVRGSGVSAIVNMGATTAHPPEQKEVATPLPPMEFDLQDRRDTLGNELDPSLPLAPSEEAKPLGASGAHRVAGGVHEVPSTAPAWTQSGEQAAASPLKAATEEPRDNRAKVRAAFLSSPLFDQIELEERQPLPLASEQGVLGPRPSLGTVVMDDGTTYSLDADYVIGRNPSASSEVRSSTARPLLLHDPSNTMSQVHAGVRLRDWDVTLVDLRSSNGTHVLVPDGRDWQQLPPDTPLVLKPGTRVAVGQRWFVFESHLRSQEDAR